MLTLLHPDCILHASDRLHLQPGDFFLSTQEHEVKKEILLPLIPQLQAQSSRSPRWENAGLRQQCPYRLTK